LKLDEESVLNVLPRRLSTQDGELTATLSIQREAVRRSFARQIDSLLTA